MPRTKSRGPGRPPGSKNIVPPIVHRLRKRLETLRAKSNGHLSAKRATEHELHARNREFKAFVRRIEKALAKVTS